MTQIRLLAAITLTLVVTGHLAAQDKPNIVLLYMDDWAWGGSPVLMDDAHANSYMPVVNMPNMERIAREGMTFSNAYGSPQCSPARACILTGQTSARNGYTVYMNPQHEYFDLRGEHAGFPVVPNVANKTMDPKTTFGIPKALKPLGYACAHIGKWHMNSDPGEHGYEVHDGNTTNSPGNTLTFGLAKSDPKPKRLTEENMKDPKLMFSITDKGIAFMEEKVKAGQPFYLQISHYAMHAGSECKVATREKYVDHPAVQGWYERNGTTADKVNRKEDPACWLGMGDDMDGRIGAVLDKIEALGIKDNTYVIVVGDNGYRHSFLPGLTQPLNGRKWFVWEGGIRVPMVLMGPGIDAGSRFKANVINYDFLPTFVAWAGGNPADLKDIDGVNLAPLLAGDESPSDDFIKRNLYFHYPHYRSGVPSSAMVSDHHKIMHFYDSPDLPMLFDLKVDIAESNNIAKEQPEVHKKMFTDMMAYFEAVGARMPKLNTDFDEAAYKGAQKYKDYIKYSAFEGQRERHPEEVAPIDQLD